MSDQIERYHNYFAEAAALEGHLELPFAQQICPQTFSKLNEKGGYVAQHSENFRLGGVVSYRSAYTQVAGNPDDKQPGGWNTLTTAAVEGLNVMDVVTADRVVAQISTVHPPVGYVPTVTFLGTRFENLRIAGHPVKLELNANILGPKPKDDAPYTSDPAFIQRAVGQYERIQANQNLPDAVLKRYNRLPSSSANREPIECSLVNQAEGSYPGHSFGHVIDVPDFGKIYLAILRLEQSDFNDQGTPKKTTIRLTMIRMEMGCVASGSLSAGNGIANGSSEP